MSALAVFFFILELLSEPIFKLLLIRLTNSNRGLFPLYHLKIRKGILALLSDKRIVLPSFLCQMLLSYGNPKLLLSPGLLCYTDPDPNAQNKTVFYAAYAQWPLPWNTLL